MISRKLFAGLYCGLAIYAIASWLISGTRPSDVIIVCSMLLALSGAVEDLFREEDSQQIRRGRGNRTRNNW